MVTGYNIDVKHAGRVYHVQTEDRGRGNPVIETLVYQGGQIIQQTKVSYADRNDDATYSEDEVARLLNRQHNRVVNAIKSGLFDPDRRPFGEELLSSRSLDECVLDALKDLYGKEHLLLSVVGQGGSKPGEGSWVVVRAVHDETQAPIAGAVVRSRIIRSVGGPLPLPEVTTDDKGEARIEFEVPADETINAALVLQAESGVGGTELQKVLC